MASLISGWFEISPDFLFAYVCFDDLLLCIPKEDIDVRQCFLTGNSWLHIALVCKMYMIGYKPILGRRRMRQDSPRKTNSGDGTRKLVQRWYPRHVIFECLMVKRLLIEFTKFQEMAFPISASCPKLHLLFPVIKLLCSVDQGLTGWISPRDFVFRCHVSIFFDLANYLSILLWKR